MQVVSQKNTRARTKNRMLVGETSGIAANLTATKNSSSKRHKAFDQKEKPALFAGFLGFNLPKI